MKITLAQATKALELQRRCAEIDERLRTIPARTPALLVDGLRCERERIADELRQLGFDAPGEVAA